MAEGSVAMNQSVGSWDIEETVRGPQGSWGNILYLKKHIRRTQTQNCLKIYKPIKGSENQ